MLDAPHAGAHGVGGALVAVRVRFDRHASPGGDLDDGAKLVFVEQEVARIGVREAGSVRGAGLDHVDAMIEVDLRRAANLLRRLQSRRELEEARVGEHVARVLEARLQVDAGGQDVRSGEVSGLDHLAKRDVGEHRDPGAARGGDAGHQRHLGGRDVRDMGVSVDEAGQHRPASRIDDRRLQPAARRPDRRDRATADRQSSRPAGSIPFLRRAAARG